MIEEVVEPNLWVEQEVEYLGRFHAGHVALVQLESILGMINYFNLYLSKCLGISIDDLFSRSVPNYVRHASWMVPYL